CAEKPEFVIIPVGGAAESFCTGLVATMRRKGAYCDMAFRGNLKRRMQRADASGAAYVVIVGDDEIANGEITIPSLQSGAQIKRKMEESESGPGCRQDLLSGVPVFWSRWPHKATMTTISPERIAQIEARRDELQAQMAT